MNEQLINKKDEKNQKKKKDRIKKVRQALKML